jgi:hypothetical protein
MAALNLRMRDNVSVKQGPRTSHEPFVVHHVEVMRMVNFGCFYIKWFSTPSKLSDVLWFQEDQCTILLPIYLGYRLPAAWRARDEW